MAKLKKLPERHAAEIRVRAERKCGELLVEMPKAKGAAGLGFNQYTPEEVRSTESTASTSTLSDLGISKNQSSTWQQLAALPEQQFEEAIAEQEIPTTADGYLRCAAQQVTGQLCADA